MEIVTKMDIILKPRKIYRAILFLFVLLLSGRTYSSEKSAKSYSTTPWSVRMVESEMKRHSIYSGTWDYVTGTFLKGVEELWRTTNDARYFQYIQNSLDAGFDSHGLMKGYSMSIFSLDNICEGRILLLMKKEGKITTKYQNAIDTLRKQLQFQPRVAEGGFWHRNNVASNAYPHQMWLDGIYMANPFYTEYGKLYNEPSDYDDVVTNQLMVLENHARDTVTGLLYHGWDELKAQAWANPVTGCSPSFWGRAVGWYAMAVVEILDYLPQDHPGRAKAIAILQRLSEAIRKVQDPVYGTWYQVLDKGSLSDNYRESSASCDFVYVLAKAVSKGYIDQSYLDVARKGYAGILNEFITANSDSSINLIKTCSTAGLGGTNPYRDGSYNYYVKQTTQSTNDGKATGPFVLASLEMEKIGFIVPPLNVTASVNSSGKITISWTDKSYNAVSFIIEKSLDGNSFTQICSVNKGTTSFTNSNSLIAQTKYYYRVKAVSSNSSSEYSNVSSVIATDVEKKTDIPTTFQLNQNYPNPFNPETTISYSIPKSDHVTLKIYDILGREVATLVNEFKAAGVYHSTFSIRPDGQALHSTLTSGIYFYKLAAGIFFITKKMLLIK
jgi:rhamnogalacturonyl hydrolase YesR